MSTVTTTPQDESQLVPPPSRRPRVWVQRTAAALVAAIGATLVVITFANNLFRVGPAFENMMGDFRPILTQQAISTDRADIAVLAAAGTEFQTKVGPTLATQFGMTSAQFNAYVAQQFPSVAAGMQALPSVVPAFSGLVTTLDQQRALFAAADAIPTKNLPATTVPWGLLAVGVVLIGVGIYMWFSPRTGAIVALVLGTLMVAVPLVLSLPHKAASADQLNANLKPVYTPQLILQANSSLGSLSAMGTEMQGKMLPALATQLRQSPAQLQAFLGQQFPATSTALSTMPASMNRFHALVSAFQLNLANYDTLKPVAFVPIIWALIASGIAVFVLGGISIATTFGRRS